jgi:hypothetical protein
MIVPVDSVPQVFDLSCDTLRRKGSRKGFCIGFRLNPGRKQSLYISIS